MCEKIEEWVELDSTTINKFSDLMKGRFIESVAINDEHMDNWLVFKFQDGGIVNMCYDYIYGYKVE